MKNSHKKAAASDYRLGGLHHDIARLHRRIAATVRHLDDLHRGVVSYIKLLKVR